MVEYDRRVDLRPGQRQQGAACGPHRSPKGGHPLVEAQILAGPVHGTAEGEGLQQQRPAVGESQHLGQARQRRYRDVERAVDRGLAVDVGDRSEEHTSELQSLMRISYAVFCLKKKNTTQLT